MPEHMRCSNISYILGFLSVWIHKVGTFHLSADCNAEMGGLGNELNLGDFADFPQAANFRG